jgi:D-amino peptidase
MKYFISVDMEGISGIVDASMVSRKHADYTKGRKLMAADTNAAIEAILEHNPKAEITVCDAHGAMNNIDPNDLHKTAVLVRGTPKPQSQMAYLDDSYDACLFVGYHSKKGTLNGVMSHTYSGGNIERLVVNGREVGETELNAGIAGHYGVPLIFVAGDQATALEAKAIHPRITTVAVKEAIGRTAAACRHPEEARALIKEGVKEALNLSPKIPPYKVARPVVFTITFTDAKRADAAALIPTMERISGKTVQLTTDDYITAYHGFIAGVLCGTAAAS